MFTSKYDVDAIEARLASMPHFPIIRINWKKSRKVLTEFLNRTVGKNQWQYYGHDTPGNKGWSGQSKVMFATKDKAAIIRMLVEGEDDLEFRELILDRIYFGDTAILPWNKII